MSEEKRRQAAEYQRDYRVRRRERIRNKEMLRQYGISMDDYKKMLVVQNNCCAICGSLCGLIGSGQYSKGTLAVDHCHATGFVRALICTNCNLGLGSFRDNPDILRIAALYLEYHKARYLAKIELKEPQK